MWKKIAKNENKYKILKISHQFFYFSHSYLLMTGYGKCIFRSMYFWQAASAEEDQLLQTQ